jgi:hypothetical protein
MLPLHVGWRLETPFESPPATDDCPDETTCLHCGEPIFWNEYSYIHGGGNAECVKLYNRTGEWHTAKPVEWAGRPDLLPQKSDGEELDSAERVV